MKKILFLFCALLGLTVGAKADVITSASQLFNTKVYTIKTTRGYMTLNNDQTMIVSTHSSNGGTVNTNAATDDASKQFGILYIDGKYFIYSPKLNKFACFEGWNLKFYSDRGVALDITNDGNGNPDGSKLRFFAHGMGTDPTYSKFCLNNNNSGNIVLNNYTTAEAGNTVSIEEVAGVTLDEDAAMEVFNGPSDVYDQHKVYNITNERVTQWTAKSDNSGITGTKDYSDASQDKQKFAFIKYDGKPHLYNIGAKKFIDTDGNLTENKGDAATIGIWRASSTTYPWVFYIEENGKLFNGQTSGSFSINGWNSSHDAGNMSGLVEVADEDAYDDMLGFFEIPSWDVTYNIYFNGNKIAEDVRTQDKGSAAAVSSAWNNDFVTFAYEPMSITEGVTSVNVTITWFGPEIYDDYESIEWKNLYVDRTYDGGDGSLCYLANTGNPPTYVKNPSDNQRASDAFQWGFVGNPYQLKVYNKLAGPTQTLHPNSTIEMANGDSYWSIKISYFDGFMIGKTGNTNSFINQYGGYDGTNMGYWSSTTDYGNVFKFDDVPDIPVTNVYYDLTYNGVVAHTEVISGLEVGADVPTMPTVTQPEYTSYTAPDVTGQTVTENMHIEVPVTWDGPFLLPTTYANITKWYDMAVRGNWYVTSDSVDTDGALKTVEANALGLVNDDYQWAFVGDPWHIKLYNKKKGDTKVYTWVDGSNAIPAFVDASTENYWAIVNGSWTENDYANSFMLTIPGTNYRQLNQNGGKGGPLKFWTSTNIADVGSAFTVIDIPTNFATFVVDDITPYFETTAKYFVLNNAAKTAIGYDESYKTECSYEQYKTMRETLTEKLGNNSNLVLPETGYYRLQRNGTGQYLGLNGRYAYGNFTDNTSPATIVKLTKGTGDNAGKYSIALQGKYLQAMVQATAVEPNSNSEVFFTPYLTGVGKGTFSVTGEDHSFMHATLGNLVYGWLQYDDNSQWQIEDADNFALTIGATGYSTLWVPFPVTIPEGVEAYTGSLNGAYLRLNEVTGNTLPANTAVVLKGSGTKTFEIAADVAAIEDNLLLGSNGTVTSDGTSNIYALAQKGEEGNKVVGFYPVGDSEHTVTIPANKAYLVYTGSSTVKGFTFSFEDDPTGLNDLKNLKDSNDTIYNLAGQRLNKLQKGINIVNGKKIMY